MKHTSLLIVMLRARAALGIFSTSSDQQDVRVSYMNVLRHQILLQLSGEDGMYSAFSSPLSLLKRKKKVRAIRVCCKLGDLAGMSWCLHTIAMFPKPTVRLSTMYLAVESMETL